MTLFLIIGVVGLLVLVASLVLGEMLDGIFDAMDIGIPTPVIASFLAAFGFGAALIVYSTDVSVGLGALGGLGSGAVIGGIALVMTKSLMNMATDETLRSEDLVGRTATVVTRIPENGLGEVSLVVAGQIQKLSARSDEAVASGRVVTVISVTSPSSVVVAPPPE